MSTEGTTHFHGVGLRGLLATPLAAKAQQAGKVYRIGFLLPSLPPPPGTPPRAPEDVVAGLRDLGYVAGQNVVYQVRYGFDRDALTLAAEELVRSKVDLPYAWGTTSTIAARRATTTIPIVLCNVRDPVRQGFVNSLAHPGGNVTGLSETPSAEIAGKFLERLVPSSKAGDADATPAITARAVRSDGEPARPGRRRGAAVAAL